MTYFARRRASPSSFQMNANRRSGPIRYRWERKYPPFPSRLVVGVVIMIIPVMIWFLYWLSAASTSHSFVAKSVTSVLPKQQSMKHEHPLRGHVATRLDNQRHYSVPKSFFAQEPVCDAIIVGSGLAGQTAALTILDRGGTVVLIEKEPILGGNSNKASSGINGCCTKDGNTSATLQAATNDTLQLFFQDTFRSAGAVADINLINTLVDNSATAIQWLKTRVGVDLSAPLVQLGGHSRRRTHRPSVGFVGAEVMNAMERSIRDYESKGYARILVEHKVTSLLHNSLDQVRGVQVDAVNGHKRGGGTEVSPEFLRSDYVILATGGFAFDRSEGSLLRQFRPELQHMATTAGSFSTGDGIRLATSLGATLRDMEMIQIHPTGFVDPADPTNGSKILAAELLRGVGGILINQNGQRFCDELGTRSYVSDKMLEHDPEYSERRIWNPSTRIPTFYLILSSEAATNAQKHVDTYMRKGLITKHRGLTSLADHTKIPQEVLAVTLQDYEDFASSNKGTPDAFGRTVFESIPHVKDDLFVGEVTPVLHYVMGGLKINSSGQVLRSDDSAVSGLFAIGEVTGGVHGNNRLGGNSLLECAVFGSIVGKQIPVEHHVALASQREATPKLLTPTVEFSLEHLSQHNVESDCFLGLNGNVYDLSSFLEHHPGGKQPLLVLCGMDATEIVTSVHSLNVLTSIQKHLVGKQTEQSAEKMTADTRNKQVEVISSYELGQHASAHDCWVLIHGQVYDLSVFAKTHPGGAYMIQQMAGKDATESYQVFHPKEKLKMVMPFLVGTIEKTRQ